MSSVFTKQIAATADDGRNTAPATGADTWKNDTLSVGLQNDAHNQMAMGLRFNNVTIPQGSTVLSASIQLVPSETDADKDKTAKIYGVDSDDAAAFGDSNLPQDSGDAPDNTATRTTAYTLWTLPALTFSSPPTSNTKLFYKLDGDSTDSSGNGYNGTDTAITYSAGNGKFVQGAGFNGTTSKIVFPSNVDTKPTGAFTISCWVKYTGTDIDIIAQNKCNYNDGNNLSFGGWMLRTTNGSKVQFLSGKNTGNSYGVDYIAVTSTTTTNDGNWHNIVATSDGINLRIYVDGGSPDTQAWPYFPAYSTGYVTYPRIGCGVDGYGSNEAFYGGNLDELLIENRVWSDNEVLSFYNYQGNGYPVNTPDIAVVVKEIVDRAGWTSGSDMAFSIVANVGTINWEKKFIDYGMSSASAAILTIVYTDSDYFAGLFSEDEKAHICLAGNNYAFGKLSPSYPLALAGTLTQALTSVEVVGQMGILTFVAGSDGATHPVFAKTATTYINNLGQMTIETPVVEGEFDGIKIHFGSDLSLNPSTPSSWIQVYTKYDNESAWSASSLDLVIEATDQYIEGFVSTNKNLQAKIVIDPINSLSPNKLVKIEFY